MSAVARLAVRVAVRMLPSTMRDRYREQWAADLRDAAEAGIPSVEIALGSLAFAATLNRSTVDGLDAGVATVDRRARLASALALTSALVVLTDYASVVSLGGLTGNSVYDFIVQFFAPMVLLAYTVLAPIVALALVMATRGMSRAVRWAVVLLVLACVAPLTAPVLDSGTGPIANIYFTAGTATYGVGTVLVVVAVVLLARPLGWGARSVTTGRRSAVAGAMGAVGIWAAGAFGVVHALRIRTTVMENGAAFLDELRLSATQGIGEFVTLVDQGGATSLTLIVVWAGIAFALGAAVLVVGLRRMLSVGGIGLFVVAALSVVAILLAGLTGYVQLTSFAGMTLAGPVVDLLLLLLGRVGLIAVVLFGIGRVRLARSAPAELVAA